MEDVNEAFSLRAKKNVVEQFKNQAKVENIKQGVLFEKMLKRYIGDPLSEPEVPFFIHMYKLRQVEPKLSVSKTVYEGYATPLYCSPVFQSHGFAYSSEIRLSPFNSAFSSYRDASRDFPYITEIVFNTNMFYFDNVLKFEGMSADTLEQVKKHFGIESPRDYHYISAFRVFKENNSENEEFDARIIVNEQMCMLHNSRYEYYKHQVQLLNPNGPPIQSHPLLPIILPSEMDLAFSWMYVIEDLMDGVTMLRLDRPYLDRNDVVNLKQLFPTKVSKEVANLNQVIANYSIF